jgi:hypothetical protein
MRSFRRAGIAVLLAAFSLPGLRGAEAPDLQPDEQTLKAAGVGTDGPALLDYIRKRTLSDDERAKVAETVRRLGHNDFDEREKASEELFKAGRAALPFLEKAKGDPDPEIDRRARECIQRIESGPERSLAHAAARVLAVRRPAEADRVLLDFLPSVPDDFIEDAVVAALEAVGVRDGKPTEAVRAALADREPSRRGAAAQVVALHCPAERPAAVKLLADADGRVRYRAATALARAGEKRAVPVLVALLADAPLEVAWQAEDLLLRLAGERAPAVSLNTGEEATRRKCRDAWAAWWKEDEAKADLTRLAREESLGLRVVCELQGGGKGTGRVVAFGPDDKIRWQIDTAEAPIDFQLLPNGNVLIAELNGRKVTERDRTGKVVFEKAVNEGPMTCLRLPNGNTFIATYHEVLEVNREGKTVYSLARPGQSIYCAQKLRTGNILTLDAGGQLIELTTEGKEVRRVAAGDTSNWGGFEILPNGHFVVARCGLHQVVEIDAAGKELGVKKIETQWPTWAGRLTNGRTVVACAHAGLVAEFDREGQMVWSMKLEGRPCRLRHY